MSNSEFCIPKKLAAKIRSKYRIVFLARDKIAYVEAKARATLHELRDYEENSVSYAELHYPTAPDPEAYPTVTRTTRLREWLRDKASRMIIYHEALLAAEQQMDLAEASVKQELLKLKTETQGSEPWPTKPMPLQALRKQWEKEFSKQRRQGVKYRQQQLEGRKEAVKKREIEKEEFRKEMADRILLKAATMTPTRAAAFTSMMEVLQERLFGDKFSLTDFYEIAEGRSPAMRQMLSEAESRAILKLGT